MTKSRVLALYVGLIIASVPVTSVFAGESGIVTDPDTPSIVEASATNTDIDNVIAKNGPKATAQVPYSGAAYSSDSAQQMNIGVLAVIIAAVGIISLIITRKNKTIKL